ncbi:MAG TPA: hypothetical protein VLU92_13610 [Candidatus Dormibacteraeota bacterium]|nr:hypothetical protein [Candidatus Dormibacteraeota bacterium]
MQDPREGQSGKDTAPPPVVLWWERLETWRQLALSFPVLAVLMLVINIGPFSQPLLRSIFYGLFEGAVFSGLLAVATATERGRRAR